MAASLELAEALEPHDPHLAAVEYLRYYYQGDSLAPYALFRAGLSYAKAGKFQVAYKIFMKYYENKYPARYHGLLWAGVCLAAMGRSPAPALAQLPDSLRPMRDTVMAWWHLLNNDWEGARALVGDLGDWPRGPSPWLAALLSLLFPGAGQVYAGRSSDGVMALTTVGIFGASSYYYFRRDRDAAALLTGALAGFFWASSVYGAYVGARARRHHLREAYLDTLGPRWFPDRYDRGFFR